MVYFYVLDYKEPMLEEFSILEKITEDRVEGMVMEDK